MTASFSNIIKLAGVSLESDETGLKTTKTIATSIYQTYFFP